MNWLNTAKTVVLLVVFMAFALGSGEIQAQGYGGYGQWGNSVMRGYGGHGNQVMGLPRRGYYYNPISGRRHGAYYRGWRYRSLNQEIVDRANDLNVPLRSIGSW